MHYRFEDFELDEERFELRRGEAVIEIEPQSLRLLLRLVEARGAVVDRETLFRDVLGVEFASDDALFKAVQRARRAVGDDGRAQRLIKTVAGRGYRFVGDLLDAPGSPASPEATDLPIEGVAAPAPRSSAPKPSRPMMRVWLPALLLTLALGLAAGLWLRASRGETSAVGGFDLEHMTPEQIDEVWRSLPASAGVATAVVGGMRKLREGDPEAARHELESALEVAPEDPFVQATQARILLSLGDLDAATEAARAALEASRRLPARRRLDLEALLLETAGDLQTAATRYDALAALVPEQPRYALAALRCRVQGGRGDLEEEFADVTARLELHDLGEETLLERLWLGTLHRGNGGDLAGQRTAAQELEREAQRRGLSGFVGRSRWLQVDALQKLGELDTALALIEQEPGLGGLADGEERSVLVRARDHAYRGQSEAAETLLGTLRGEHEGASALPLALAVEADVARLALQRRDLEGAERHGAEAIGMARRLGNLGRLAGLLTLQADVLTDATRFDEAEAIYLEALTVHRRHGDRRGEAGVLLGLGLMHRTAGDPHRAAERLEESVSLYRELGLPGRQSIALYNLASVNVSLCRLDAARDELEESRRLEEALEQTSGVAWALHGLALASFEAAEMERAAEEIREALALRRQVGDRNGVVGSEVRLALILDHSDQSQQTLEVLDRLLAGPLASSSEMRSLALNLRSYALIHLGRWSAAAENVAAARRANAESDIAFAGTLTDLTAAELDLQRGDFEQARESAARARDHAELNHDLAALVEARRLLLEAEHELGLGTLEGRIERARALVEDAERFGCTERGRRASSWLERLRAAA